MEQKNSQKLKINLFDSLVGGDDKIVFLLEIERDGKKYPLRIDRLQFFDDGTIQYDLSETPATKLSDEEKDQVGDWFEKYINQIFSEALSEHSGTRANDSQGIG